MNVYDVVKSLGLTGNGEGGLVHVRNLNRFLGPGTPITVCDVRIVELNPPEATVRVTGICNKGRKKTIHRINVNVDDLIIAEQGKVDVAEKDPLKKAAGTEMPRLPQYDYNQNVKKWMLHSIEAFLESCACTTGAVIGDLVEVINVAKGNEFPLVQCRAKVDIPTGSLKLFPHGGVLAFESAVSERESVEARLKSLAECYFKCVQLHAVLSRKGNVAEAPYRVDFFFV